MLLLREAFYKWYIFVNSQLLVERKDTVSQLVRVVCATEIDAATPGGILQVACITQLFVPIRIVLCGVQVVNI